MAEGMVTIKMARDNLGAIPQHCLAAPYHFRWYQGPRDVDVWLAIQHDADKLQHVTLDAFRYWYGHDEGQFKERICFLCDGDGREIGTASAWYDDGYRGRRYGRVHWVAIVPSMQGRGLSKPLITTVMNRFVALGHDRAYLTTEDRRIAAVRLYLSFGFLPDIADDQERSAWETIRRSVPSLVL
jgi:GNAT superfamily N-acetyltransferase